MCTAAVWGEVEGTVRRIFLELFNIKTFLHLSSVSCVTTDLYIIFAIYFRSVGVSEHKWVSLRVCISGALIDWEGGEEHTQKVPVFVEFPWSCPCS